MLSVSTLSLLTASAGKLLTQRALGTKPLAATDCLFGHCGCLTGPNVYYCRPLPFFSWRRLEGYFRLKTPQLYSLFTPYSIICFSTLGWSSLFPNKICSMLVFSADLVVLRLPDTLRSTAINGWSRVQNYLVTAKYAEVKSLCVKLQVN